MDYIIVKFEDIHQMAEIHKWMCAVKVLYHNHLFSIPEIHQSGYRTCQYITTNTVQNESLQYNMCISWLHMF
jgi:hypothetical protein